jgi:hypothetical protein
LSYENYQIKKYFSVEKIRKKIESVSNLNFIQRSKTTTNILMFFVKSNGVCSSCELKNYLYGENEGSIFWTKNSAQAKFNSEIYRAKKRVKKLGIEILFNPSDACWYAIVLPKKQIVRQVTGWNLRRPNVGRVNKRG